MIVPEKPNDYKINQYENTNIPLWQWLKIFNSKVKFVILMYIKIWNARKDPWPELNDFFSFEGSKVILLCINMIKK
jgi:hypothetical protein